MKRALRIVGIVVGVIVVAVIALPFGVNVNSFRPRLEAELSSALGRQVKVGSLSLSIFGATVAAQDISIADDPEFSLEPFVKAKSLKVGVELLPLVFSRSLHITELTLEKPEITLVRGDTGKWNFSSLGESSAPATAANAAPSTPSASTGSALPDLAVKKLDIKDGLVSVSRTGSPKPHIYDKVNVTVSDFSFTSQFPFTFSASLPGGGEVTLDGKAGPINPTDTSLTPLDAQVHVKQLDLALSGFADLFPGLAGVANFDGTAVSDGHELHTNGVVNAEKLKLVENGAPAGRPVQIRYAIDHQLETLGGSVTQGDIVMGKALAQLTGTYQNQGAATVLTMKVNAQNMPVNDLEAMLPALGVVLPAGSSLNGGTLSATLDIDGPADGPVITGPIRLSNTKLARFDLGSKLSSVGKSANSGGADTSIQNFSTNARIAPEGVRGENISLTVPALGVLTGNGTISPGGALNFKMTATLSGTATGAVTQRIGLGSKSGLAFYIHGTTSNPTFDLDAKGTLAQNAGQVVPSMLQKLKNRISGGSSARSSGVTQAAQKTPAPAQPQPSQSKMGKLKHKLLHPWSKN